MIYDNPYCLQEAEWLVNRFGDNKEELIKEISGNLYRLYHMGRYSVMSSVTKAMKVSLNQGPK